MRFPFEVPFEEITRHPKQYIDALFSCLESEFLTLPRGKGFIEYPVFEHGYEALKAATAGFTEVEQEKVLRVALKEPVSLLVLRAMLGFTPPEWAYIATQESGIEVSQGFIRTLDRQIRLESEMSLRKSELTTRRLTALIRTACRLLSEGAPKTGPDQLHRLDKADTKFGSASLKNVATLGVPYAMLLYERFLGRSFAGHRDSVSELVGNSLEAAIEDVLSRAGISYRKTKRAERIAGFDQAPDFIVPSEFNPQVIIEAKITEDDGTARDKVTRIQHLGELSRAGADSDIPKFEVVACIGGRGFGVRREDMKKMLLATRGKIFTIRTLEQIVEHTRLQEFRTKK
ncbi:MAG: hypothetical protein IT388_09125 [Nitrospirales bacterium]|nr:hypothetical protein [Nitrospirales bacterium]